MDAQRALLDELMGAARNLTEEERKGYKEITWDDKEVCGAYMVRFCPHDLFINTRSDLGPCPKIHDPKLKESFEESPRHDAYVPKFEAELAQFCEKLVMDLDRRVKRGRERLAQEVEPAPAPPLSAEKSEQLSVLEEKIKNLLEQVETLGEAGKVDEAEALMRKVDMLNSEKTALAQHPQNDKVLMLAQEKKMALCEICGSFLVANDALERTQSHVTGKQHIGYGMVRDFITEYKETKEKAREEERLAREKEAEERRKQREKENESRRRSNSTRPPYVGSSELPEIASELQIPGSQGIADMRAACELAARVLDSAGKLVRPSITTNEIDKAVHQMIIDAGAYPSPLGYGGFPKSVCTSVNECMCHGIPDSRQLQSGDIINIDVTVYLNGYHGDTSKTFLCGDVSDAIKQLVKVTEECLERGIAVCKDGASFKKIGKRISEHAEKYGYGVVERFVGHGVGTVFHSEPLILHHRNDQSGCMVEGQTFTIEPILTMGSIECKTWPDNWTTLTADGSPAAQFEHTILITRTGAEILTIC